MKLSRYSYCYSIVTRLNQNFMVLVNYEYLEKEYLLTSNFSSSIFSNDWNKTDIQWNVISINDGTRLMCQVAFVAWQNYDFLCYIVTGHEKLTLHNMNFIN